LISITCPHCGHVITELMGIDGSSKCTRCNKVIANPEFGDLSQDKRNLEFPIAEIITAEPLDNDVPPIPEEYIIDSLEGNVTQQGSKLWILYSRRYYGVRVISTFPNGRVRIRRMTRFSLARQALQIESDSSNLICDKCYDGLHRDCSNPRQIPTAIELGKLIQIIVPREAQFTGADYENGNRVVLFTRNAAFFQKNSYILNEIREKVNCKKIIVRTRNANDSVPEVETSRRFRCCCGEEMGIYEF
jgi:hypothetical protein